MQIAPQITYRNVPHSDAVDANIRERIAKLDAFFPRIMSCRVVVEGQHRHHHQGNLYHVRVDLVVPGREFVVSHPHHDKHAHEDVYVAIRDAFDAARRQLEDYAREVRGSVKTHEPPLHGKVLNVTNDDGYILSSDGREIFFHRNSVVDGSFDKLLPGSEVRFSEEATETGPHATTVHVIGKHHIV
ncbi:MAG: HPF/RaiA family ribosome-associated protein [Gammaproteobacteria bacterium]